MARAKKDFGRSAPPVKTGLAEGVAGATPPSATRKRSIAVALLGAGAVAAAAVHYMERRPSQPTCVETPKLDTGVSPTGVSPTGVSLGGAPVTGGAIGPDDPDCPPGTRRTASTHTTTHSSSSSSRRSLLSGWHWSSSSGSSSSHFTSTGGSSTRAVSTGGSSPSISRGGFGSTGSFHASGGS
jgi:hypothetical protein